MLHQNFCKTGLTALALASSIAFTSASNAAIVGYAQDHEALNAADGFALGFVGGEQYGIFADVWFGDVGTGTFLYNYGVFSAPNGGAGFSAIAGGEGGVDQGSQYLNIYSDYGNVDHGNGFNINTSVFQEQNIDAGDIGSSWTLTFDYKAPSSCGIAEPGTCVEGVPAPGTNTSTARAFIKTLDPNNGFATTNDISFDTTTADPNVWNTASITLDLSDGLLANQLLQFGFNTVATDYNPSGVYYDNINFAPSAVPVPAAVWLFGSGLLGLVGVARRSKS